MSVCTENNPAPLAELFQPYQPPMTNLVDQLNYWVEVKPENRAFGYLSDGENVTQTWTYAQLVVRAQSIAAELKNRKLKGQRVLLLYPPCIEFIEAVVGCQFAGAIPVPAFPPRKSRNGGRIDLIAKDADAKLVLTNRDTISRMEMMLDETECLKEIPILASEEIPSDLADEYRPVAIKPGDVGLLQYTSGSTGSPKGVVLTHGNLIENCKMITHAFQIFDGGSGISWLPTYHDMGLVGGILNPLFIGCSSHLLPPLTFLAKPVRWLKAISELKATVSGGPNFAYQLCVDKVSEEEMEGLDLSLWEVAFNGAEPVRSSTLNAFNEKFARVGFRPKAHYPCYGMAETTLLVTGGHKQDQPDIRCFDRVELDKYKAVPVDGQNGRELVGCGHTQPGETIVIVDPNTNQRLEDEAIGEIWVDGPSVGMGYWEKPEESAECFQASYNGSEEKFLRTGDLGFFSKGQLFVTGRLKDLIIIRGVNRYPQDIESTVEQSSLKLQGAGTAAFSVEVEGAERLVIVSETERSREKDWSAVIEDIRKDVTAEHDVPPDAVVMVRTGSIQKTSSGKIQRHACKAAFLEGSLKIIDQWVSWDATANTSVSEELGNAPGPKSAQGVNQSILEVVVAQVKAVAKERAKTITMNTNIVIDLGLDSLERLQIANSLEEYYRGRFPDEVLQDVETVQEVVLAIEEHFNLSGDFSERELKTPTAKRIDGEIPDEFFNFALTPEVARFERQKQMIDDSGVRNPFFSIHEGGIGD
ncbi:MAG: AMP-binding protein, partial [Planctomycetota bacterium]|nr:AMP-binding protein [Planctomycetota bacterium]